MSKTNIVELLGERSWELASWLDGILMEFNSDVCTKCNPTDCCCKGCVGEKGYILDPSWGKATHRPIAYKEKEWWFKLMKKQFGWDKKTGFWRKDGGCVLPRQCRSVMCLWYMCPKGSKFFGARVIGGLRGAVYVLALEIVRERDKAVRKRIERQKRR